MSCGVYFSTPSKKRRMSSGSLSAGVPSDQTRNESPSRSAQAIATTRCRCSGRKSPPVAARRRCSADSATSGSDTPGARAGRRARAHCFGMGVDDFFEPVHPGAFLDLRQIGLGPLADAWNLGSLLGLAADDLDLGILFPEKARYAHDGAGGAHAGDEMRDPAPGVAPDLRPGALVMRLWIVRVGKLVEDEALAFALHALRHVARRLHAALLRRKNDLRTEGAHVLATLRRKMLRHDQHHAIAADRRRHRQRDAGVAAGRLDGRVPR